MAPAVHHATRPPAADSTRKDAHATPVYLIEDNRLLRDSIAAVLKAEGFRIVGAARGADDGLPALERAKPRVVLLEAGLADSVGIAEELRRAWPDTKVVAMNFLPSHEGLVAFIRAGVAGFTLKDASADAFVASVRRVVDGAPALPRALGGLLFRHVAAQSRGRPMPDGEDGARLTRREREVIELIADGMSNKEIADRLHVATHTVKSHVHGVLGKLALRTRLQIAAFAHAEKAAR